MFQYLAASATSEELPLAQNRVLLFAPSRLAFTTQVETVIIPLLRESIRGLKSFSKLPKISELGCTRGQAHLATASRDPTEMHRDGGVGRGYLPELHN